MKSINSLVPGDLFKYMYACNYCESKVYMLISKAINFGRVTTTKICTRCCHVYTNTTTWSANEAYGECYKLLCR